MGQCCSNAGIFMAPEVTFERVWLTGMGLDGIHLSYVLSISNPNMTVTLPGKRVTFVLHKQSDHTLLAEGVSHQDFQIGPSSTTDVTVPIVYSFSGIGAAGKSLIQKGTTMIELAGEITFEAKFLPGGETKSKYYGEGEVILT